MVSDEYIKLSELRDALRGSGDKTLSDGDTLTITITCTAAAA